MTKFVSIKQLQTNTKKIREEVEKGMHFIVIWRSKPIFEIRPLDTQDFAQAMKESNLYTDDFVKQMKEAQEDIKGGKIKTFTSTEEFLKSLS